MSGQFHMISGATVTSYNSFEEMQADERTRQEKAAKWVSEDQKKLLDGKRHYFVRAFFGYEEYLYIYGMQESLEALDFGIDQKIAEIMVTDDEYEQDLAEWEYEKSQYRNSLANNFLYGKCYSEVEPTGEYGSTHVSQVAEISEDTFNEAKALGWPLVEGAYWALMRERSLHANDEV